MGLTAVVAPSYAGLRREASVGSRRRRCSTRRTRADDRDVRDVDLEPAPRFERLDGGDDTPIVAVELPLAAARAAVEMTVLGRGQHVEFLSPVGSVAVAQDAELFQDVEGSVHG